MSMGVKSLMLWNIVKKIALMINKTKKMLSNQSESCKSQ
jgi:hypothetical protein